MNNLFVITSPLQVINAIEAREHFKTNNNILVAVFSEFKSKNKEQIINLINEKDWNKVLYFDMQSSTQKQSTFLKQIQLVQLLRQTQYDFVFCGDFSSSMKLILANVKKNQVFLLDDGATTINRYLYDLNQDINNKKTPTKLIRELRFNICGLKTKVVDVINLFTSYKFIPKSNEQIIFNDLKFFQSGLLKNSLADESVYLLGQPLREINIVSNDVYLDSIAKIIKHYQDKNIIYIPHRAETLLDGLKLLEGDTFKIKNIELPIELYFLQHNIYPKYICSFWSSALFTLNILYPKTIVEVFKIDDMNIYFAQKQIQNVYNYLENNTNIKRIII